MRLLVELSLEHPTLPLADARGAAESLGAFEAVDEDVGVLVADVEGTTPVQYADRLALAHDVSAHWWTGAADAESILASVAEVDLAGRRFAVRARRVAARNPDLSTNALERALGERLARTGRVDLESPEVEVRVLVAERAHVGIHLASVDRDRYEARHVRHRPLFSPIAIHPRQARALLNLARVRAGERVLDPFCGTGGLALEAALVGARVLASDLDPRMVEGTRELLRQAGVEGAVVEARDVGEAPEFARGVDAVITDPPYGRASTTMREGVDRLYARFLAAADAALRPGGRLAVVYPEAAWVERTAATFTLLETHALKVHRSLTRHFAVYEKPA